MATGSTASLPFAAPDVVAVLPLPLRCDAGVALLGSSRDEPPWSSSPQAVAWRRRLARLARLVRLAKGASLPPWWLSADTSDGRRDLLLFCEGLEESGSKRRR